jgi:peroxiredoxin
MPLLAPETAPAPLPERMAAFRANFEAGGAPAWVHEPMHRATAELIASGAADHALKAGAAAAGFVLKDADGREVSSAERLEAGPLVITFYRGVWCPYCNLDLQALQAALPEITARGASLVAISPQTPANSRRSQRENHLEFPILSDPGGATAAEFGLRFRLPDYLVDLYKNTFKNDLEVVNGDPSWTLPMPARYVVAPDGTIAYAEVHPDYTRRPDPSELLPVLDRLRG